MMGVIVTCHFFLDVCVVFCLLYRNYPQYMPPSSCRDLLVVGTLSWLDRLFQGDALLASCLADRTCSTLGKGHANGQFNRISAIFVIMDKPKSLRNSFLGNVR
ncbi:hypothetical protein PanWU01x14_016020 [Parasponia andersonii]|uniref:Secreted protein n=1 Tax=Parasponia andersonii TaxID=3476 RepID=A0A2P5E0N6_PARAD|nr:hypothetical protein PanWU01x14_016020 [Parasponia andersonii]